MPQKKINTLPPQVETWLVSNTNAVSLHTTQWHFLSGTQVHVHPEYDRRFKWLDEIREHRKFVQLEQTLSKAYPGTKNVIAIFEDKSYQIFRNVKQDFTPSLANKKVKATIFSSQGSFTLPFNGHFRDPGVKNSGL